MLKPSNISDDFDDVSLAPITGEGRVLELEPTKFDDEKVKKLLAELDALESNSGATATAFSTYSLPSTNNEFLKKEISSPIEAQKSSQPEVLNEATEKASQEYTNTSLSKEDPQQFKKISLSPTKFRPVTKDEKADEKSNSSLLKVATICIVTLFLSVGAAAYSFWQTSTEEVNAILPVESQELFADTSDEAANFVRKSNSKSSGTTLEQALAGYLNSSIGQNWQALGWKSSLDQEKQNFYSVTFVWKEGQERKETAWLLDIKTKRLVPIGLVAEKITPLSSIITNDENNNKQNALPNVQPVK